MANRRPSSSMDDREEDRKRVKLSPEGDPELPTGEEENAQQPEQSSEAEGKETERKSGTDGKEENGKEGASGTDNTETEKKKVKAKSKKEKKKEMKALLRQQKQDELRAAKEAKKAVLQADKDRDRKRQKTQPAEGVGGGKDEQGREQSNGKETPAGTTEKKRRRRRHPASATKQQTQAPGGGTYRCEWVGCGRPCPDLVDHINRTHVGAGLRSYTCGWEACTRKQEPFTKRPAMMKHLKKHLRPIGLGDFELSDYRSKSAASEGKKEEGAKKKPKPDEDPDVVLGRQGAYSRLELCCSDVVWTKISGYPWWPARLESPFESPANMDMVYAENVPVGSLLVRLYGVNRLQWVTDEQILGFKAFWDEFHGKCQLRLFQTALTDAQRDSNHYPAVSPNPQLGPLTGNRNRTSISIARQPPSHLPSGTLLPPPPNSKAAGLASAGAPLNSAGLVRPGGLQGQGPPPRSKGSSPVPGGQPTPTYPLSVSPQPKSGPGRPSGAVSPQPGSAPVTTAAKTVSQPPGVAGSRV